jgi:hypothetical protein
MSNRVESCHSCYYSCSVVIKCVIIGILDQVGMQLWGQKELSKIKESPEYIYRVLETGLFTKFLPQPLVVHLVWGQRSFSRGHMYISPFQAKLAGVEANRQLKCHAIIDNISLENMIESLFITPVHEIAIRRRRAR